MIGKNATWPGSGCSTEMPSNRYSFVRGRPPLMRGSGAEGGGGSATPGARLARVMKLRPLSPFARQRLESAQLDAKPVGARCEWLNRITAPPVGHDHS